MIAFGLVGCASARPPVTTPQLVEGAAVGLAYGTVAAVRPIRDQGAGGTQNAAILAAMGLPPSTGDGSGRSSEIVVRTDAGDTLSVVEPDAPALLPGERVVIVRGGLTRLAPASPQT